MIRSSSGSTLRCSCDLLLLLAQRSPGREVLAAQRVDVDALRAGQIALHEQLAPEPADWHRQLVQRGASSSDLEQLLAIVRSAESHGYQLLERLGVGCARLRRDIIERLRSTDPSPRSGDERPRRTPRGNAPTSVRRPGARRSLAERPVSAHEGPTAPSRRSVRTPREPHAPVAERQERTSATAVRAHPPSVLRQDTDVASLSARPSRNSQPAGDSSAVDNDCSCLDRSISNLDRLNRHLDSNFDSSDCSIKALDSQQSSLDGTKNASDKDQAHRAKLDDEIANDQKAFDTVQTELVHGRHGVARDHERPAGRESEHLEGSQRLAPHAEAVRPARAATPPSILRSVDRRALPPLHGREAVLAQVADALLRHTSRPPVLVGPPGSGRSMVARHLARVLDVPVFVLDTTAYDDEEALSRDLAAVARAGGVAVLDDLDRVPADAVPPLLAALARTFGRREPPVLIVASPESCARLDLWLPGGATVFDRIAVPTLPAEAITEAVAAAAPAVLRAHGVTLAPDASLDELTRLADHYLAELAMPGRALDLLDLSCARATRRGEPVVTREIWLDVVSERSGLPRARLEGQGDARLLELEQRLATQVVGHAHVTRTLAQLIRRNRAGFGSHRPVLSTLLLGPSGVGKTEIAKALGQALFERADALVRLDMSEYAEPHAVARVVGAPPGYVGHEQGGALTDPLRRRPHCVVLLDEIEKAHREVHQLLLQVLDEGRLTDGRGRVVDLHHAVIVMTSNLGADRLDTEGHLCESAVLDVARRAFPVELWNRIEAPLVLQPLGPAQMLGICRRLARDSSERLFRERGIRYALADEACEHLVTLAGRDPALGARPLRHLMIREVESVIAEAVLRGRLRAGTQVEVAVRGDRLVLR